MNFEKSYEQFWNSQVREATGQRSEMLNRDLKGTKLLLENVLLPVFGTFDGMALEYEMIGPSGVKIYGDVGMERIGTIFEEDHFVTHAKKITRDRFSFERARARTVAINGFIYFPYSRDELEKKPELCRRNLYELLGRMGSAEGTSLLKLPVYEREVLRCAMMRTQPFQLSNVSAWLQLKKEACRNIMKSLIAKGLISPVGGSERRSFAFAITKNATALLVSMRKV
ncbi:hypothetical protein ACF3MZ_16190 [Paenibacillaceae bacterium WGS1546]|uniref:hypothetical protein n=1 Tax=Cohnella sp. WGS1546 TaxID=3366810 RepID=UPI00372D2795